MNRNFTLAAVFQNEKFYSFALVFSIVDVAPVGFLLKTVLVFVFTVILFVFIQSFDRNIIQRKNLLTASKT